MWLERISLPSGDHVLIARDVDPADIALQPGDRSVRTAQKRAVSVQATLDEGGEIPPPLIRQRSGRLELWDGNARLAAYRASGRPLDAILVGDAGQVVRTSNEEAPLQTALWDSLVAEIRARVDAGDVPFGWPSAEARDWVRREYVAAGGRFGQRRGPRGRAPREHRQLHRYLRLFGELDTARDLYSVAEILGQSRQLKSPTLRGALTKIGLDRAATMGFVCPRRLPREKCLEQLLEFAAGRQARLFNSEDRRELWMKWRELVNMTPRQIERFMETPEGKSAGLSRKEASEQRIARGRDSGRALLRMLPKGGRSYAQAERNWTKTDWEWARRQVGLISRMRGAKGPLYKDGGMTRKLTSLLVWGHDPRDA